MDEDDNIERTIFVGKECFVYKVPNRGPNGYVASEWKEADFMWKGRVRVTEQGDKCSILLEDPMSGLFLLLSQGIHSHFIILLGL